MLGLVLLSSPGTTITLLVGLPLLAHLGYRSLTSLPAGRIPGRPSSKSEKRKNYQLRANVGAFLNEVKRMESYVQRARSGGVPRSEVKQQLRTAEKRLLHKASQVAKATGKVGV